MIVLNKQLPFAKPITWESHPDFKPKYQKYAKTLLLDIINEHKNYTLFLKQFLEPLAKNMIFEGRKGIAHQRRCQEGRVFKRPITDLLNIAIQISLTSLSDRLKILRLTLEIKFARQVYYEIID